MNLPNSLQSVAEVLRTTAMKLRATARNGLTYSRDPYDIERFHAIAEASQDLANLVLAGDPLEVHPTVESVAGYTTPKVDVRGAVFDPSGAVLLVREKSDGAWSLPGGWCDVLESPRQAVVREIAEETGLTVDVLRIAAVLDRELWGHEPPFDFHVYKLFFVCEVRAGSSASDVIDNREISSVEWFPVDQLPTLSASRVTAEQVKLVHARWRDEGLPTAFD